MTPPLPPPIRQSCLGILAPLHRYWLARPLPPRHPGGKTFSARFLADLMLGHLAYGTETGDAPALARARLLAQAACEAQEPDGSFRWRLPDRYATHPGGVRDQVDLGMVLDALDLLHHRLPLSAAEQARIRATCRRAACYLETALLPDHPGVVRKRHYERDTGLPLLDVFNGDALAAKAFRIAARWTGEARFRQAAQPLLNNLLHRFGQQTPGWWPYAERLPGREMLLPANGEATHGLSVFYQAMTAWHLSDIARLRPTVAASLETLEQRVAEDGHIPPEAESRAEFHGKPNALVAGALLLLGRAQPTRKAARRLEWARTCLISPRGETCDANGAPLDDRWQVWLFADVARLLLRFRPAPACAALRKEVVS